MKKIIAIIGDACIDRNGEKYRAAFNMGKALIEHGYRIQSGGLGGVMEAAFAGARAASAYREGDTIAIVPSFARDQANEYADIVIPTGLDILRNAIVANADAVIAIGGGAGTLSEMAIAWSLFRLIIAFDNVEGWSAKLAGQRIDSRTRYPDPDDRVFAVSTPEQAIGILEQKLTSYTRTHKGIQFIS